MDRTWVPLDPAVDAPRAVRQSAVAAAWLRSETGTRFNETTGVQRTMATRTMPFTADEVLDIPVPDHLRGYELVDGELADGTARLLRATDVLDGEPVLPGFRLPLARLFPSRDPAA